MDNPSTFSERKAETQRKMAKGKKQIRIVLMDFCRLHVTGLKGALSETFERDQGET